jgi:inward rectifier potassium channel
MSEEPQAKPKRLPGRRTAAAIGVRIVGASKTPLRDFYHVFLRVPWPVALGFIVAGYLLLNTLFALGYLATGGLSSSGAISFADAFNFSIQTMGTIGYGATYPVSRAANLLVAFESVTGLLVTALATGLVFSKFARPTARVVFSERAVICLMDGVPTLMFRIGNERGNQIMDAEIRVAMVRTEHTREGQVFYRMYDLVLTRSRAPALSRSWTVMHPISHASPLFGQSPASLKRDEIELTITLSGMDDISLQPIHASKRYLDGEILWGARFVDVLSEDEDGGLVLDLHNFHRVQPSEPTEDFPYPERESAGEG